MTIIHMVHAGGGREKSLAFWYVPGLTLNTSHYLCIIFADGQAKAIAHCAKIALPQKLVTIKIQALKVLYETQCCGANTLNSRVKLSNSFTNQPCKLISMWTRERGKKTMEVFVYVNSIKFHSSNLLEGSAIQH